MSNTTFFVPDGEIPMDKEHSLEQLSGHFQTVKSGLPELVKNSKDQYSRLGILDKNNRQIFILISENNRLLGVLDFAGASAKDFEKWKVWSLKEKRQKSSDIEAGYGNGGKSFMVRASTRLSYMCSLSHGKYTKMGYTKEIPGISKFRPIIFKNGGGKKLQDIPIADPQGLLQEELEPFGISFFDLPESSRAIFLDRETFTLVVLDEVEEWLPLKKKHFSRVFNDLKENISNHAQTLLSINSCEVYLFPVSFGQLQGPLSFADLEPYAGLNATYKFEIPDKLEDPQLGQKIDLEKYEGTTGHLEIKTTKTNMRSFGRHTARNSMFVKNRDNYVANWSIADLDPKPASAYVYGELYCPSLSHSLSSGSSRTELVDTPLVRALRLWTSKCIKEITERITKLEITKNTSGDQEKSAETLEKLRELMQNFLDKQDVPSVDGTAAGDGRGGVKPPLPPQQQGKHITHIELETAGDTISMAISTVVPLKIRCYEITSDGLKLPVKLRDIQINSDSPGIVSQADTSSIYGVAEGMTNIWCFDKKTKVKSNIVRVNVVAVSKIVISSPKEVVKKGERVKLNIETFNSSNQLVDNMFYEAYVDQDEMGKVTRTGSFHAGGISGDVTIRILYGSNQDDIEVFTLEISEESEEFSGGGKGYSIPYIVLCTHPAPGTEEFSEVERTHPGGEDHPTIIDYEPQWLNLNVVWINTGSKEAKKYKQTRGRVIKDSSKTFQRFLALKCFELLKRLKVRQMVGEDVKSINSFFYALAAAETECSGFVDSAFELVENIIGSED